MSANSFPDYHNNPFRLTIKEIENPTAVIDEFFESYNLPEIRACLDEWLHDGMLVENIESKKHFSTYKDIEKLVEACWVIRQNQRGKNVQSSFTVSDPVNTNPHGK